MKCHHVVLQDVAPVELLRWAGGLLGLPVHAAHLLSSGHTHLLGEPTMQASVRFISRVNVLGGLRTLGMS